ncbi:hypothetical protein C8R44DRAFT_981732 [Mycena epipterygia]|nr:hypothetical protein C8R44DRAFT_981732 [Mycena epipterygia]
MSSESLKAIQVHDICDYIVDFLHQSPQDLMSCALVSRVFTSSAQHHLFRTIDLTTHHSNPAKLVRATRRLHTTLSGSPHLIPLIRRLSVLFEPEILEHLTGLRFTNAKSLLFVGSSPRAEYPGPVTPLAAELIALPSVRRVKLMSITFTSMEGPRTLFRLRRAPLDLLALDDVHVDVTSQPPHAFEPYLNQSLVIVTGIEINSPPLRYLQMGWLLDPRCPLDFSALTTIEVWSMTSPPIMQLMHSVQNSLHTLRIDAPNATPDLQLSNFPGLTTLDIFGGFGSAKSTATLLETAGVDNHIDDIHISISVLDTLDDDSLRHLDVTLTSSSMSALRIVHIVVSRVSLSWSLARGGEQFVARMRTLRSLFPTLDPRGYLKLTYVNEGVRRSV